MAVDLTLLATGALSFTVALAWNRAVNQWVESRYPPSSPKATAAHALAAAVIITLVVIAVVEALNRAHRYVRGDQRSGGPDGARRPRAPGPASAPAAFGCWCPESGHQAGGGAPSGGFSSRGPELSCRAEACRACAHCFPRPIVTLWD